MKLKVVAGKGPRTYVQFTDRKSKSVSFCLYGVRPKEAAERFRRFVESTENMERAEASSK